MMNIFFVLQWCAAVAPYFIYLTLMAGILCRIYFAGVYRLYSVCMAVVPFVFRESRSNLMTVNKSEQMHVQGSPLHSG